MRNFFLVLNISALAFFAGCSKGDQPFDPTLYNKTGFKGITFRDEIGNWTGSVDKTDWKNDGYWDYRYPVEQCSRANLSYRQRMKTNRMSPSKVLPAIETPKTFATHAAYPNPFNPSTTIDFDLASDCHVYASIINDRYETVQVLVCDDLGPGDYIVEWSAMTSSTTELPSDIYRFIIRCTDSSGNILFASHGDLWLKY